MKVRCGFVTNSSSSSFVVVFKNENTIEKEVDEIFKKCPCDYGYDSITDEEIVAFAKEELLEDAKKYRVTLEELCDILRKEFARLARRKYYYETRKFLNDDGEYLESNEYKSLANAYIEEEMNKVLKKIKTNEYIVYTSFADDDGVIGSYMEHTVMPSAKNTIHSFSHH